MKQTKTQATGQPHQAIKGFTSGRNFYNIRRQLHKKEVPHKMLVKHQQQIGNLNLTKQKVSSEGETFTISEEYCKRKHTYLVMHSIC